MVKRKKKILKKLFSSKKRNWFKSTLLVIVAIFIFFSFVDIWFHGWDIYLGHLIGYSVGLSFVTIVIILIGKLSGKKLSMA